jgi:hypothetical protein
MDEIKILSCSECFQNRGLKLDAEKLGILNEEPCPACKSCEGKKLTKLDIVNLAHRFFTLGTMHRCDYGAAPIIQFNQRQTTTIKHSQSLANDIELFEKVLEGGFFLYGPRTWMIGEIEPLKSLINPETRNEIIKRIITEYPRIVLNGRDFFYRIRKNLKDPEDPNGYDSPPSDKSGNNRFDSNNLSVMYASQDLQVCVHECRVTAEDDIYVATIMPSKNLYLLDLSAILVEEKVTEFESLDMAVHTLFLAGEHSYEICRDLAVAAYNSGFDGIVYPSYFSHLRTGTIPFQTTYGFSLRRFPQFQNYERSKIIPNLALFGYPIANRKAKVSCINKLIMTRVDYDYHFGPVGVL